VKSIEGVEEFFLDIFFTGDKLDVIDENTISFTIFVFETVHIFGLEGGNEFVTKGFSGEIFDF